MPEKDKKKPISILTPFGKVKVPQPELPPTEPPKMTKRRHDAMKHAVGLSIASWLHFPRSATQRKISMEKSLGIL